jgi:hypothetical protein
MLYIIGIVLTLIAGTVVMAVRTRRAKPLNAATLGWMSEQWLTTARRIRTQHDR